MLNAGIILLEEKADLDYLSKENGFTPLMLDSTKGHDKVVKLLCKYKTDVSAIDYNGKSAMTIFLVIVFGIFCCKQRLFDDKQIDGFELLLFKIIMPCYLFVSVYQSKLSNLMNFNYMISYLVTFMIMASIVAIVFFKNKSATETCIRILESA